MDDGKWVLKELGSSSKCSGTMTPSFLRIFYSDINLMSVLEKLAHIMY